MSRSEVLLSIVVPTRGRAEYATNLVRSVHTSKSDDFELIVRDNSDEPELDSVIRSLNDTRIRYDYSADPLNMHQNFDDAIALATGRFVCAIGDDDSVLIDRALEILRRACDEGFDAVLTQTLIYNWPGLRHRFWGDVGGIMAGQMFPNTSGGRLEPEVERERVFRNGVTSGLGFLPRVYQGFVSRRSLDALRQQCGTTFPGASPDMANAIGLVPFVNGILYSPRAAIISGHSPKSGGGAGTAGQHHGRLEDRTNLPSSTLQQWDTSVPRFWSGVTIYAQSAITAAKASDPASAIPMAHHRLYAACLIFEPPIYRPEVLNASRTVPGPRALLGARVLWSVIDMLAARAITFVSNFFRIGLRKSAERHDTIEKAGAWVSRRDL